MRNETHLHFGKLPRREYLLKVQWIVVEDDIDVSSLISLAGRRIVQHNQAIWSRILKAGRARAWRQIAWDV